MVVKKRRCTALRADGAPCRAWAVRGTGQEDHPTLCAAHGGLASATQTAMVVEAGHALGFEGVGRQYDDHLSDLEFTILEAVGRERSLEGEVRLVRVALRRLFADFGAAGEVDRRAETLFKGAELVARLLKYQRELEEDKDSFEAVIEQALAELGEEWGIELVPEK